MNCRWMRRNLSAYVDGELEPLDRFSARLHLRRCADCFAAYERVEQTLSPASQAAPVRPPANLKMRLRLALRNEAARETWGRRVVRRFRLAVRDSMRPLAIRSLGGVLSALLLFGALMPDLWTVRAAGSRDVPLTYLAKDLVSAPTVTELGPYTVRRDITVIAYIDPRLGFYDLELPGEDRDNQRLRAEIANVLLFSTFEPATVFGRPVPGRVLITFTRYIVKG